MITIKISVFNFEVKTYREIFIKKCSQRVHNEKKIRNSTKKFNIQFVSSRRKLLIKNRNLKLGKESIFKDLSVKPSRQRMIKI
jgi:hypothetical protein